jgi:hypothetical protein
VRASHADDSIRVTRVIAVVTTQASQHAGNIRGTG